MSERMKTPCRDLIPMPSKRSLPTRSAVSLLALLLWSASQELSAGVCEKKLVNQITNVSPNHNQSLWVKPSISQDGVRTVFLSNRRDVCTYENQVYLYNDITKVVYPLTNTKPCYSLDRSSTVRG